MQILNIAGYQFVTLDNLAVLRAELLQTSLELGLKGTILLSVEGINLTLAGTPNQIELFKKRLLTYPHFQGIHFRESYSASQPFKRMKVRIKSEIITMYKPDIRPDKTRAPSISPVEFKQWLDEARDITILDTRNEYEVSMGTFVGAMHLGISDFSEFPDAAKNIRQDKPVVMFCTGGVRCEKAALQLKNAGFPEVYQLDGGILNYFTEVGSAHYQGNCFVFDERVAVDSHNLRRKE